MVALSLHTVCRRLEEVLREIPEVRLAYLFGSQVSGHTGPLSDYDVAVLLDREVEDDYIRLMGEVGSALRRAVKERIDLVVLNKVPVELAYAVIATGVLIYEENTTCRVDYEAYVLGRYGDYLPILRTQREQILQEDQEAHERRVQRYREALRGIE